MENRHLHLGDYVELKSGEVHQVLDCIEEERHVFLLDNHEVCTWRDIKEIIREEDVEDGRFSRDRENKNTSI